jgi:hypothetical protein
LTDFSQLVLAGKYQALLPIQGLKLSERSASHTILWKHGKFQLYCNNTSNQNCICEGIKEQFEIREYLLLFGLESFVFQFSVQKYQD